MNLVDDHRVDASQPVACVRREQEEERLGRGDQDVGWLAQESLAIECRRVARANGDRRGADRDALGLRDVGDAGERGAQVALDVNRERLEG